MQVGSFAEDEALELVLERVAQWADKHEGVRELVQYLHGFPLAVVQAAEYARVYKTLTPGEYLEELKSARLELAKDQRHMIEDEYPHCFPEVVKLSLDKILQSGGKHAEDAGRALRKLALVDTEAIPLDLLTPEEREAVFLLQEHSLVTEDEQGRAAMHALTQLVVRDLLTDATQRSALVAVLTGSLMEQMQTFDSSKPKTYKTCTCRAYGAHVKALLTHVGDEGADATEEVARLAYAAGCFFSEVTSAFADARRMFERALAIRQALQGQNADSEGVADCLSFLGSVCERMGEYALALQRHKRALEMRTRVFRHDHLDVATSYNNIGIVYDSQGRYKEALQEYEKCLKIRLDKLGHEHPDVAASYNNMANVYDSQGKYEQALEYHQKALSIFITTHGDKHLDVAKSYNNIGMVYDSQGKYDDALDYYQKSLKIKITAVGSDHLDVAASYNNIGLVHEKLADFEKALFHHQKALKIRTRVVGQDHLDVAASQYNIGVVHWKLRNWKQVTQCFEDAYKIRCKVFGEEHPSSKDTLKWLNQAKSNSG